MPRIEIERLERAEALEESSAEEFDRIAFAERAIALIRPRNTTVAICEGSGRLTVEAGRQWGAPAGSRWAVVAVPPRASRRAIASAVLALHEGPPRAWALDVLLSSLGGPLTPAHGAA